MGDAAAHNPHFLATDAGNKSPFTPSRIENPFEGPFASLIIGRLVSVIMGLVALVSGYVLLKHALGNLAAALTVGLMAFNPQFIFITSSFSNDAAVIAATALCLPLIVRVHKGRASPLLIGATGLALGIAILAKLSGAAMLGVLAATVVISLLRSRRPQVLVPGCLAALVAVVISAWWFWRNANLYGDPLALNVIPTILGRRESPIDLQTWLGFLGFVWKSYWVDFSVGGIVFADSFLYWGIAIVVAASLLGTCLAFSRSAKVRPATVILVLWLLLVSVPSLRMAVSTEIFMGGGRLIFPAAVSVAGLMGIGLDCLGRITRTPLLFVTVVGFLILSIWAPDHYLRSAYPSPTFSTSVPSMQNEARIVFREEIELVGYDLTREGNDLVVRYHWLARKQPKGDYSIFLQQLLHRPDGRDANVAQLDTYPAYGSTRTGLWKPGTYVTDELRLKMKTLETLEPDAVVLIATGLYDRETMKRLPISSSSDPAATLYGDIAVLR